LQRPRADNGPWTNTWRKQEELGESEKKLAKARRRNVFDPRVVLTGTGHGQVRKRFQAGQVIYSQGDPPEAAFFVEIGSIKVSTVVRNGREAVLALHGAGDFFGVRCLLGTPHTATATALIDSSLIRVTTAALCRMVREVPDFAEVRHVFGAALCRRPRTADQPPHAFRRTTFGIHAVAARKFKP
jgi:hypothetical protein